MKNISKRTLAVLMAALMLLSVMSVSSFATLTFTLTASDNGSNVALTASSSDYTYTVEAPSTDGAAVSGKKITINTLSAGNYTITAKNSGATDTGTVTVTAQKVTFDIDPAEETQTLIITNNSGVDLKFFVKGLQAKVQKVSATLTTITDIAKPGSTENQYTIIGYYFDTSTNALSFGEKKVDKFKEKQTAPSTIKPTATEDSITIEKITGAEYAITDGTSVPQETDWTDENVFTKCGDEALKAGQFYTVYARMKATSDKLASDPVSVKVKTLKPCETAAKDVAPVEFASVTKTAVTIKSVDGYEYSNDGKTWSSKTNFTGLTSGKSYTFYQRVAAKDDFAPSAPTSKSVTTNTADIYTADIKKIGTLTWKDADNIRMGKENEFTLSGDIRTNGNIQWGDTCVVPVSFSDGTATITSFTPSADGSKFAAKYTPASTGEKKITVIYQKKIYKGTDGWVNDGEPITQTYNITVLHSDEGFWGILVKLVNFLTGQFPQMLANGMKWLQEHGASFLIFI